MSSSIIGIIMVSANMRRSRRIWISSFQTMWMMRDSEAIRGSLQSIAEARGAERDDADAEEREQQRVRPQHGQPDALQIDAADGVDEEAAGKEVAEQADRHRHVLEREDEAGQQHGRH